MPPKLKAGSNLTQKRKSHLANEPAKRPKTGDSSATPTTPKKSTSTTNHGTPKKTIINLAAKATSLPDEAYFHPTAVKLFDQITVYSMIRSSNFLDN
jgi:2-oxoglutarate dehydrogenase complex dehydrogenase (E1) component-like enzyme